jgi:hypothetical protein
MSAYLPPQAVVLPVAPLSDVSILYAISDKPTLYLGDLSVFSFILPNVFG